MNTLIHYLYRDAANYKSANEIVAAGEITDDQRRRLAATLDDSEFFIAEQVDLPPMQPSAENYDPELDHAWHQIDPDHDIELTDRTPTDPRTIEQVVAAFEQAATDGWDLSLSPSAALEDDAVDG